VHDGLTLVQELTGGGTPTANLLTGLGLDETFARTDGSVTSTLLADAQGSTLALANGAGAVQTRYTFEPFGATTLSGATSSSTAQFTGRDNDGTGLYYYRARFYHPGLQRFTSEDPLGFGGGLNAFVYAGNAPTMFGDPLGLKPRPGFGGGGGDGNGPEKADQALGQARGVEQARARETVPGMDMTAITRILAMDGSGTQGITRPRSDGTPIWPGSPQGLFLEDESRSAMSR
jgi:RHS repeat-associated protein